MELEDDLGDKYGYIGIDTSKDSAQEDDEIEVCGYPGDKEPHTMWHAIGGCKKATDSILSYKIPTYEGQSGCPIIKREKGKEFIVGVHIGGDADGKRNYAVRLTTERRRLINEWMGSTETLDLSK